MIAGLTLISTPIWERVIDGILKDQFSISISGPNDAAWGFALCALALIYHLLNAGIYDALRNQSQRERSTLEIEHDRKIFMNADAILPEQQLEWFLHQIETDHSYRLSQTTKLDKFCQALVGVGETFVRPGLHEKTGELLRAISELRDFIGLKFFVYPEKQSGDDFRLCMMPAWNCDRGANPTYENLNKYDNLSDELLSLVDKVRSAYKDYRLAVKRDIVV